MLRMFLNLNSVKRKNNPLKYVLNCLPRKIINQLKPKQML